MGAPKQKWTAEEEAALKAGVRKHGAGKWQTILRDPEFSHILRSRSNVDLKDKWRNINVTLSGLGSREKARLALKRNPQTPTHDDTPVALNNSVQNDENNEEAEAKDPATSSEAGQLADPKRNLTRLDNIILEALTTLKEPKGADKNAIFSFIEERYWAPPNLKKLLSSKLKFMAANGKLMKVKHRYRIGPSLASLDVRSSSSDGKHGDQLNFDKNETRVFTKPQVEAELERMRGMTPQEAAALAAQAVAEAEAAIAAAEAAAQEAEAAEAEAEAAQVFAEAAMKALKCQRLRAW
ncbi:hypothetical protein Dimus_014223 [Dionaea muscipula]